MYPTEFKERALNMVAGGRSIRQVAEELGIPTKRLYMWKHRAQKLTALANPTSPESLQAENDRLRRELAQARADVDFLKKAAAFFASNHR